MILSSKRKTTVMKWFIISIFFEAYYFFGIIGNSGYSSGVTMFVLLAGVFIIVEAVVLLTGNDKLLLDKTQIALIVYMLYEVFNCLIHGVKNFTSPLYSLFLCTVFLFLRRKETTEETHMCIELFSKLMNIMAVYGIYQFLARMFGLPFGDLIIKGHMVEGYNWTDELGRVGLNVTRSNAVFLEPSFFSQMLAINLLIMAVKIIEKRHTYKTWVAVIINVLAFVLSFSGTGVVVLGITAILYLIFERRFRDLRRILGYVILAMVVFAIIVAVLGTTESGVRIIDQFIYRFSELTGARGNGSSGYVRFIGGGQNVLNLWKESPYFLFFGVGPGTGTIYRDTYNIIFKSSVYYWVAGEYGLIGLLLFLIFLLELEKRGMKNQDRTIRMITLSIIPLGMCHGLLLQNYSWIILSLINVSSLPKDNITHNTGARG